MKQKDKKKILDRGYNLLKQAEDFNNSLESWAEFLKGFDDLEKSVVDDPEFSELNIKMMDVSKKNKRSDMKRIKLYKPKDYRIGLIIFSIMFIAFMIIRLG
jgi:hypothetical protein